MPGISGLGNSVNLRPLLNVGELQAQREVQQTKQTETAGDVQKTVESEMAKTELASIFTNDSALGVNAAEKFAKANTVETPKAEGEKKAEVEKKAEGETKTEGGKKAEGETKTEGGKKTDDNIGTWFKDHPNVKLAMAIVEKVLEAVIGVVAGIAKKLPDGVGDYICGGLTVLKGFAGFHKMENVEKDLPKALEEITKGAEQIANGLLPETEEKEEKKEPCQAAKIINSVGTLCKGLGEAKSWEDAVNAVGTAAVDIALSTIETKDGDSDDKKKADSEKKEILSAVKDNVSNFTQAISNGIGKIKDAVNESEGPTNEKMVKSLELFQKTLAEDNGLPEDAKNLVKSLSDGAIASIKSKGTTKTMEIYESTLGEVANSVLKGKNKEVAEKTISLMKEIRKEEDPFKAAQIVLDGAKALAGGASKELDALTKEAKEKLDKAAAEVKEGKGEKVEA